MSLGGITCEYTVNCGGCGIDPEPGKWYGTLSEAMRVRNRVVKDEGWQLTDGELLCPDCLADRPPRFPGADCSLLSPGRS
jgi:hypothetical protein